MNEGKNALKSVRTARDRINYILAVDKADGLGIDPQSFNVASNSWTADDYNDIVKTYFSDNNAPNPECVDASFNLSTNLYPNLGRIVSKARSSLESQKVYKFLQKNMPKIDFNVALKKGLTYRVFDDVLNEAVGYCIDNIDKIAITPEKPLSSFICDAYASKVSERVDLIRQAGRDAFNVPKKVETKVETEFERLPLFLDKLKAFYEYNGYNPLLAKDYDKKLLNAIVKNAETSLDFNKEDFPLAFDSYVFNTYVKLDKKLPLNELTYNGYIYRTASKLARVGASLEVDALPSLENVDFMNTIKVDYSSLERLLINNAKKSLFTDFDYDVNKVLESNNSLARVIDFELLTDAFNKLYFGMSFDNEIDKMVMFKGLFEPLMTGNYSDGFSNCVKEFKLNALKAMKGSIPSRLLSELDAYESLVKSRISDEVINAMPENYPKTLLTEVQALWPAVGASPELAKDTFDKALVNSILSDINELQ